MSVGAEQHFPRVFIGFSEVFSLGELYMQQNLVNLAVGFPLKCVLSVCPSSVVSAGQGGGQKPAETGFLTQT